MPHHTNPALAVPASVRGSLAASRRTVLKAAGVAGLGLGAASALSACGGGGSSDTLRFGLNEGAGSGPAYERGHAMVEAFTKESGVKVTENAVDHNTFQEQINSYLQGNPDDVFSWFSGYRMDQFAEQGLIADISDVWPIEGLNDAFKASATATDGKQYFVPNSYYPWALFHNKAVWDQRGYQVPTTWDEMIALFGTMKNDGIVPMAFSDKDGWPAMGTFDILNMRLNGYDFHMSLMKGDEDWTSDKVKNVFDSFRQLLEFSQPDPLGRTWQEAATSMGSGESGMYLLGTFVVDAVGDKASEIDLFNFPEMDSSIGASALDAPIDGFCVSASTKKLDEAKKFVGFLGTAKAADAANDGASAPMIAANADASTAKYTDLQKKSVELVQSAEHFAQFMDRDTRADFASTVMIPAIQTFIGNPTDIDSVTKSIQEQKVSIFGS